MKGTILIYRPGAGLPEVRAIEGPPTLDALKAAIGGGMLEGVPYFNTIQRGSKQQRCVAFCDEEGKLKGLPLNTTANKLWDLAMRRATGCGPTSDFLVGSIAVVFGDDAFMRAL